MLCREQALLPCVRGAAYKVKLRQKIAFGSCNIGPCSFSAVICKHNAWVIFKSKRKGRLLRFWQIEGEMREGKNARHLAGQAREGSARIVKIAPCLQP